MHSPGDEQDGRAHESSHDSQVRRSCGSTAAAPIKERSTGGGDQRVLIEPLISPFATHTTPLCTPTAMPDAEVASGEKSGEKGNARPPATSSFW